MQTRTPGAKDQADIIFFIVDGKAEGIESRPWDALGVRANSSGPIRYSNVLVPQRDRLGAEGQGKEIIYDGVSPVYLIGLGAVWEGVARGALNAAIAHTTSFVHKDRNKSLSDYRGDPPGVGRRQGAGRDAAAVAQRTRGQARRALARRQAAKAKS